MDVRNEKTKFVDIQIIQINTKLNKYCAGILNLWIVLTTKYTQLFVQQIKIISQYFQENKHFQ